MLPAPRPELPRLPPTTLGGHRGRALPLSPPAPITHPSAAVLGFLQLGAQGLGLAGCGRLSLLGLLQPLEQVLLPLPGSAELLCLPPQPCLSLGQLLGGPRRGGGQGLESGHGPP